MNLSEALMTSLLAIRTADSGSGGLSNTSADAYVQRMVFSDHPNFAPNRDIADNTVLVQIIESSETTFGVGASTTSEKDRVIVRLECWTRRDTSRTRQDAMVYRLRTKIDGVTPSSQTGWTFGPITLERVQQLPATDVFVRTLLEFSLRAGAGTVVETTGRQASITFSGSEGAAIGATLFGYNLDRNISPETWDVTRWGDVGERIGIYLNRSTVTVGYSVASMVPVPPTGTPAVLVVFDNASGTGKTTYTNAILIGHRFAASTQGDSGPCMLYMTFRISAAQEGTNPIVAA